MFSKSDQDLINQALDGRKSAWMALVKRYESSLYNYGIRMTGNREDALDLLQETFISVHRNLATYRGEGSFKAWLFRIAHFRCVEFYRRKKGVQSLDDCAEPVAPDAALDEGLSQQQGNQQLVAAMQRLPMNQKAVVELKFFGQFTFEEIAEQLAISSNTAKSRLYSALASLRTMMEVEHV